MGKIVKLKPVKVWKNREHDDQTEHPRPPRALLTHHSSQPHTKPACLQLYNGHRASPLMDIMKMEATELYLQRQKLANLGRTSLGGVSVHTQRDMQLMNSTA